MKNMFLALALAGLTYVPSISTADVDMDSDSEVELAEEVGAVEEMEMVLMNHHQEAGKNHHGRGRTGARRAAPKACKEANITEAQKTAIKATMTAAKTAKAEPRKAMKAAHVEFMTLAEDANATLAQAEAASAKMLALRASVAQIDAAARTEILFKTLQPEQRIPAMKCHHAMKAKHARGGRAHGARHGQAHGRGHGQRHGAGHGNNQGNRQVRN